MISDANWQRCTDQEAAGLEDQSTSELARGSYTRRGFLPQHDPVQRFPPESEYAVLDEIGHDLPSLLHDRHFRHYARSLKIPAWGEGSSAESLPLLRLYYLRLGFLAAAYINQVGERPEHRLPANIAVPLAQACRLLNRPPILSYDGYALYNWKRFRRDEPVQLGNIDTIQNFVHLYDEHWFILVHVEIEAIAADILAATARIQAVQKGAVGDIGAELGRVESAVRRQVEVLKRIPEKMDPRLYYKTFRPYIRFFDHVTYENVAHKPLQFRGETGAQSSIMPVLVALMKIPHKPSLLTDHLADMRNYMPPEHRRLIDEVAAMEGLKATALKEPFNGVLDAMADFRTVHFGWANEYIARRTDDPRGTGGTPYMKWLNQMIEETLAHKL